jgi:hypothetical protein
MRECGVAKPPRPFRIVRVSSHGPALRAARPARTPAPRKHHCETPLPVAASTTMVAVMCGCKEQK